MEHLVLPVNSPPETHVYPGLEDYIGIPFLDYPRLTQHQKHEDWDREAFLKLEREWESYVHVPENPIDDTPFLATWFFCGILQEILHFLPLDVPERKDNQHSLYRHSNFVKAVERDGGAVSVFCTSDLLPLLEEWTSLVRSHKAECKAYYQRVNTCLKITWFALTSKWAVIDPSTKQVILSVLELLQVFVADMFASEPYYDHEYGSPNRWTDMYWQEARAAMVTSYGWCPYETARVPETGLPFIQIYAFLAHMARHDRVGMFTSCPTFEKQSTAMALRNHQDCTSKACQIDSNHHQPQDRLINCTCKVFGFSDEDRQILLPMIKTGTILLKARRPQSGSPCFAGFVSSAEQDVEYAAISHVWTDGLGNSDANEILQCRLDHVMKAVFDAHKSRTGADRDEVYFWLDTLCCPVAPITMRHKVLLDLRAIYANAAFVLVLDGELQTVNTTKMTDLEIGMWLSTSKWMTRLWTLQEAYLAREIWVRFQDRSLLLDGLKDMKPDLVPPNQRYLVQLWRLLFRSLRKNSAEANGDGPRQWTVVRNAMAKRKVTVAADEALCVANYLDLSVDRLLTGDPADRMKTFWESMNTSEIGIPRCIVLNKRPRLKAPGYGWAPTTLLGKAGDRDDWHATDTSQRGMLTKDGFLIKARGYLISKPVFAVQADPTVIAQYSSGLDMSGICWACDQHGLWYSIIPKSDTTVATQSKCLLEMLIPNEGARFALVEPQPGFNSILVRVDGQVDQQLLITTIGHVSLVKDSTFNRFFSDIARKKLHDLCASSDFKELGTKEMLVEMLMAAKAKASELEQEDHPLVRIYSVDRLKSLLWLHMQMMLAGKHHIEMEVVPDGQEWCFM